MPIYEYQCPDCKFEFSVLVLRPEEEKELTCSNCGGKHLKKLISRVAFHLSETDRLAQYDPRAPKTDSFYKDSRNIGLHAKKRAQELGVDLGSSFDNKLEKLRTDPGSVLKDSE